MPYREPQRYEHNERDRERYGERFWKFPTQLVTSYEFANWWRESGKRGGGSIASTLPVLALEAYPAKKRDSAALDGVKGRFISKPGDWTPRAYLSHRRIATLAGCDKSTVGRTFEVMNGLGIADAQKMPCRGSQGRQRTYFRLASRLFAEKGEKYTAIHGSLVYGGLWLMLPSNAARHLYLVLSALDPVYDEDALGLVADEFRIEELREKRAASLPELMDYSGLARRTLIETLDVLTTPVYGTRLDIPMFTRGGDGPFWYARDRRVERSHWNVEFLNGPREGIAAAKRNTWAPGKHLRARRAA